VRLEELGVAVSQVRHRPLAKPLQRFPARFAAQPRQGADETLAGMVIVALEDVSFADVPSAELGRVEMPVSDLRDQGSKVDFFLPIPLEESADVNASVHVDVDGDGQLSEGDWTSPEIVPVSSFGGSTVAVSLIEI
jgi:hypothetical protein